MTGAHGGRRYLLAEEHAGVGTVVGFAVGHTIPATLTSIGGDETFLGGPTQGLSMVAGGSRVYAAWHDGGHDELMIAPYDLAFDLPAELKALLDQDCNASICPPDPRLICAATNELVWVWEPPNIMNAHRGDVVLTPADGAGIIGTLLSATEPKQFFDHMGIMVEDHTLIRHCTMAHKRVKAEHYYTGSVLGAQPAPTDGLRPDLVKYGWPGTMTQTIEDAFFTGFNSWSPRPGAAPQTSLNPRWDYYALHPGTPRLAQPGPGASGEELEAFNKRRLFYDPERTDDSYPIQNMPNVPAYRADMDQLLFGRVVKPSPELEAKDPSVRAALHRVADAAEQIQAHYRFYAYSQARIGIDRSFDAPPQGDQAWQGLAKGADWAAGTHPLVCSSFVWAAVQRASKAQLPRLFLEGETTELPEELLGSPPIDGLYRYTEDERRKAGEALASMLADGVRREVRNNLATLEDEFPFLVNLTKYGVAAFISLLTGPVAFAAAALGCTPTHIADLALLFNDMPDQLANQMCNTFAFDRANDTDSDDWHDPDDGLAVSPDDIMKFWDVPTQANDEIRHGLWGDSQTMLLVEGRPVPRHRHVFQRSEGVSRVRGAVRFRGDPIMGAEVQIGCDRDLTSIDRDLPEYRLEVGAGPHEIVAGAYWPGTNQWLSARRLEKLLPGDQVVDLDLEEPPAWRRIVRVRGQLDLVHRVLIGHDDWLHQPISKEARFFWHPSEWGEIAGGPPSHIFERIPFLSDPAGNERVHFTLELWLKEDLTVGGAMSCQLLEDFWDRPGEDMSDHIETGINLAEFTVPEDGSHTITIDQKSVDWPPDRGHLKLTITNDRAPA